MTFLSFFFSALVWSFFILLFRKKKDQMIAIKKELNNYKEVAHKLQGRKCISCQLRSDAEKERSENVKINTAQARKLMASIAEYMKNEQPYLDSRFNMNKLSEGLGVNRTYLSYAINQECGIRFETYVNSFRVRAAIEMLSIEKSNQFTLEYIALKVGFQSKSTFNRSFRHFTGVNPSFFVRKIREDDAAYNFFIDNFHRSTPYLH